MVYWFERGLPHHLIILPERQLHFGSGFLNDSGSISDLLGNLLLTIIPNNILAYWTTPKPNLAVQIIDNRSPIMPPQGPKF